GLGGDDIYYVDNGHDKLVEAANGGDGPPLPPRGLPPGRKTQTPPALGRRGPRAPPNGAGTTKARDERAPTAPAGARGTPRSGGAGADKMAGAAGNDTYVVDNAGDAVFERPGEGIDTVQASVSTTLSRYVENLTLRPGGAIDGTGNADANLIIGNEAANTLNG